LGLEGTPLPTTGTGVGTAGPAVGGKGGWMNPALMVQTSQGVMHRDAAARLGLEGTPLPTSPTSGGSQSTPAVTRTPNLRPMPPSAPALKPGGAGPRLPAPGSGAPGIPGVPA